MRRSPSDIPAQSSGYALLLVMFFLALVTLSLIELAPATLARLQREKETEMLWRGKQYVRGVRMYYNKMHRFPTSLDDLTQPKTGIRFMRRAYKDPMNQTDGSWRLIYVGPNGQLIGSLNQYTVGSSGSSETGSLNAFLRANSTLGANSSTVSPSPALTQGPAGPATPLGSQAFGSPLAGANGSGFGASNLGTTSASGAPSLADASTQSNIGAYDGGNTFGGNVIGVGSKINKQSFLTYQKAKNYRLFEFVWDPAQNSMVSTSASIGTPVQSPTSDGANAAATTMSDSPLGSGRNPMQGPMQSPTNQNPPLAPNSGIGFNPDQSPQLPTLPQ